ncbi:MAG: PKD domain-containing protein [Thermoplasmatota archaeon]|jgi:PKD repeat protein
MKVLHLNLRIDTIIITILVLLVVLASFPVMAETSQVYYVDLTEGLPDDWTIINGGNTNDTWKYLAGGFGVFCDDRTAGPSVIMDEQLISPIVNCLKLASVFLEYYHNFNGGKGSYIDQGDVYVSNDGGASWVNVATYLPGTLSQRVIKIDITSIAAGYSKVMIKFYFHDFGSYGYWWQVFNVKISGELKEFFDPPVADFSWSPNQQYEGFPIQFTDLSSSRSCDIVSWSWDFGGVVTSSEQNPVFTFMDDGIYTVTLTVTDEIGYTDTVSYEVTVLRLNPVDDIEKLIQDVKDMNLHKGIQTSLIAKLDSALQSIKNGCYEEAISALKAFMNEAKAQSGKKILLDQANYLIESTQHIINIM